MRYTLSTSVAGSCVLLLCMQLEGMHRMYSQKISTDEVHSARDRQRAGVYPRRATVRRQIRPAFLHMGPVALTICSVLLVGLMAVLYLSQQAQAVSANQQLQSMRSQQSDLTRQNQDLTDVIATEKSPAHIADQANKMGLIPVNPANVQIIKIHHLQPLQEGQGR